MQMRCRAPSALALKASYPRGETQLTPPARVTVGSRSKPPSGAKPIESGGSFSKIETQHPDDNDGLAQHHGAARMLLVRTSSGLM